MKIKNYNIRKINVLIIDDDVHLRQIVKGILRSLGVHSIRETDNGADALKILSHFPADIIFCDWNMDPLDGLEFTRLVRTASDSPNPYVPIIMVTAHNEFLRVIRARDAGINEYLVKPVTPNSLYARICSVIDNPRPYIRSFGKQSYFGPTRRRQAIAPDVECERRKLAPVEIAMHSTGYA